MFGIRTLKKKVEILRDLVDNLGNRLWLHENPAKYKIGDEVMAPESVIWGMMAGNYTSPNNTKYDVLDVILVEPNHYNFTPKHWQYKLYSCEIKNTITVQERHIQGFVPPVKVEKATKSPRKPNKTFFTPL